MSKQDKKELRQQIACEWLEENYLQFGHLRHDVVTDRLQVRCAHCVGDGRWTIGDGRLAIGDGQEYWRNLTDKDINTMVCNCVMDQQINIAPSEMWTALRSDMIPSVHPLRDWLNALRPYTADQPDWIDWLAQLVVVAGGEEANQYWRHCFKKWLVAMVASWMKDEVVNHTVLVFVGRQGIFKTTWLDHLIPPALRAYSSKLPLSGQINKDDRLRLCENGLLNMDELDAICGREMNIVKSLLTSTDVNERAAYGRLKERRVRLASFCASTNNREFLTDITGNRRWLPFEVESIQNPFYTTLPYELIYAQAKALVEDGMFEYWFNLEEIEQLEKHNEEFRALENEEQLIPIYFAVPAIGSKNAKFLTTAEISEKLVTLGNIKRPMSLTKLGIILKNNGFMSSRQGNPARRGWIVYERDSEGVEAERRILSKSALATCDTYF